MPRAGFLLLAAVVLVSAGCLLAGAQSGYVLAAEHVPADELGDHATVTVRDDARAVAVEAAENGSASTAGWRAVRNGSLVAVDGSYYRFHVREFGEDEAAVPGVAVVSTNEPADVEVDDLPFDDSRAVHLAVRHARIREREGGSVDDPSYALPYYQDVEDSRLLSENGVANVRVVSASGARWRVVVFENVTREATVWSYDAELVASSDAELRRELTTDLSGLPDGEREHLETATEEGETLVPTERVESGEAEEYTSLLQRLGFEIPADRWQIAGDPQSTYVTHDGRVYFVEFWWESAE